MLVSLEVYRGPMTTTAIHMCNIVKTDYVMKKNY